MFYPSKKEFIELSKKGNLVPVYKEIIAGQETPVSAFKKIEGEYSFLLESIEGGENIARYSFLGTVAKKQVHSFKSFEEIRSLLAKIKPVILEDLPRFHGGLVGYVSYDMIRQLENIPDKNKDDLKLPNLLFFLTDTILAFDHVKHKIIIISNAKIEGDPGQAYEEACLRISGLEKKLAKPVKIGPLSNKKHKSLKINSNLTKKQFEAMVKKCQEYIFSGDIIQAVLSQRFVVNTRVNAFKVYRVLRKINPSPYMYYLKFGKIQIVGSSPEVMVRLENGQATLRPIAGTRPRGKNEEQDKQMEQELLASKKEQAEHIMLVDLGRNDLGRVCDYGSVKVTEQMAIERYSHVMHIVSNVVGTLQKGKDAIDLLTACFPAGTVSGAPKVRAMQIIDELESIKRGPYAGSVGYFGFSGELDSCITIRTIVFSNNKAYVQAGAGIVADSVPSQEYQETINKAKAMLKAIELAQ